MKLLTITIIQIVKNKKKPAKQHAKVWSAEKIQVILLNRGAL